jgi:hypothetical protein
MNASEAARPPLHGDKRIRKLAAPYGSETASSTHLLTA